MTERDRIRADEIKKRVAIPTYFDHVIVPNMSFYYDGGVNFDSRPYCKCPLHSEDTGSFKYFDYSNSYYCYGCGSGGDIIALHKNFMKENNNEDISFEESINFLYSRFVDGNDTVQLNLGNGLAKETPLSTNVELARFSKALMDFERFISTTAIELAKKSELYIRIDKIDKLVRMNMLNASDAKKMLSDLRLSLNTVKITSVYRVQNTQTTGE